MEYVVVSATLIIFGTLFSIFGCIIGKKLYNNVRDEVHQERGKVIQRLMKTYSFIQCVGWPFMMVMGWLLYVNKTGLTVVQPFLTQYIIITMRFVYMVFRFYIGFNSLIIASCRYCFIVLETHVINFGFDRTRRIFLSSSIGIPILLAVIIEATHTIELAWICMFMPSQNHTFKELSEVVQNSQEGLFCSKEVMGDITESPLYSAFEQYLSPSFRYGLKICFKVLALTATSNIIEGFMYFHIFVFIKR